MENKFETFKSKLIDGTINSKEIDKYLFTKGVDKYNEIVLFLELNNIELTWKNVSSVFRYDKRICYLLQKYFVFLEEYLRATISNSYEITEITLKDYRMKLSLFNFNEIMFEKVRKSIKDGNDSIFNILENSLLSFALNFITFLPEHKIQEILPNFEKIKNKLDEISNLRNRVMHSRFLLNYTKNKGDKIFHFKDLLENFVDCLPEKYTYGEDKYKGFIKELQDCNKEKNNQRLLSGSLEKIVIN